MARESLRALVRRVVRRHEKVEWIAGEVVGFSDHPAAEGTDQWFDIRPCGPLWTDTTKVERGATWVNKRRRSA